MTVKYLTIIQIETIAQTISDKVYNPTIEHLHTEFSNKITEAVQTFVGENIWTSFLSHPKFFKKTYFIYFRNLYDLIHPIFLKFQVYHNVLSNLKNPSLNWKIFQVMFLNLSSKMNKTKSLWFHFYRHYWKNRK